MGSLAPPAPVQATATNTDGTTFGMGSFESIGATNGGGIAITNARGVEFHRWAKADAFTLGAMQTKNLHFVVTDIPLPGSGGILSPATAQVGKRLAWAQVVAVGQNVRTVEVGDRVLFEPEDRSEVELHGATYVLLRERDVHAVASSRVGESGTGLYL